MALYTLKEKVELREILLKNKPVHMLQISPKATIPVLLTKNDDIIDESMDIIHWVLKTYLVLHQKQHDWLEDSTTNTTMNILIDTCDQHFKYHLDRYKYATNYVNTSVDRFKHNHQQYALDFIKTLNNYLTCNNYLFADMPLLADFAIFPFVRQFAHTDWQWWQSLSYNAVINWLETMKNHQLFTNVMEKYPVWNGHNHVYYHG